VSARRDRLVSLSTVLLALAGGVALGGGPLQADAGGPADHRVDGASLHRERTEVTSLRRARAFDDAYLRATAPQVLRDRLRGRAVTLVTLPGADPRRVAELAEMVGVAGGAVTVQARVLPSLLDVGNRQLVAELARQTQEAGPTSVRTPGRTEGYELAGRLLGHALLDDDDGGAAADRTGEGILAGLTTAGLVSTREPVTRRGSVAIVVAGPPRGSAEERQGAGSIVTSLMTGLDVSGDGAVLAGPAAAAEPDGVVGALRAAPARKDVSTVGSVDSVAGAAVAVRALAAEARGRTGHYGGADAPDGVLPGA
jgi:hypothetical protein